jgi:hypothetical protein
MKSLQPPQFDDQRLQQLRPLLDLIDHAMLYLVCCTMVGVVLYLALQQVH